MNYFSYIYKNVDKIICSIVACFAIISILIIGSTSINVSFFSRSVIVQTAAYIIGVIAILFTLKYNYTIFKDFRKILYPMAILILLTVYIPGLGTEINSARSWINLRVITLQPSELVKILFILIMASYLNEHKDELYNFKCLIKAVLIASPIILIVLKEDFGSALVFASIWLFMMFFSGIELKALGKFFAIIFAFIPIAYLSMAQYQKDRIEAFLHSDNLSLPGNYQVWQSKVAIGSGGFWGKGLFGGTQKSLDFIPVQTSDFFFSVLGEELGLIGGFFVIALYLVLLLRMMYILRNSIDFYGALIISGLIGMFVFQIFENIAMTMGLMPVTGITLPFLSYGGSSIVSNMLAVALVLNIAVRSKKINF